MTASLCMRAVEFRATDGTGDGRTLEGYGAVFGQPARISSWEGDFDEEIMRGAFRKTLKARTPVLQFDHGRDARTGTVPIGAIDALTEDEQGLYVSARLFDNPVVEPVRQAIEGGSITGMSIRFQVSRETWTDNAGAKIKDDELPRLLWEPGDRGPLKRSILEIDPLYELGPVVFPAYDTTSVGVRSLLAQVTADDRRWLLRELTRNLPDFTGQPGARSAGGGEHDATAGNGAADPFDDPEARDLVLRAQGVRL